MRTRPNTTRSPVQDPSRWLATALSVAAVGLSLAVALPLWPASAKAGPNTGRVLAYEPSTGTLRFVGSTTRSPIPRPPTLGAAASPTVVTRAFLARLEGRFGIRDQARELRVQSVRRAPAHGSVVRMQQVRAGVPVLGGELVVNLDRSGNLLSAGGEISASAGVSVVPSIIPSAARRTAVRAVAHARQVAPSTLAAGPPALWIYDSSLMGGPGLDRATLVWRMDVVSLKEAPIRELVLVDARLGNVVLHFDRIETARSRRVCDAANTATQVPCVSPVRTENDPPSNVADVNGAYEFSGDTYDFYRETLGRDSLDGAGMSLVSTTRYCPPDRCPYPNAFWDGQQMVYGEGFASADDVVAHELSHGVIDHTSRLFYYYQSGAINESLADTLGEFVDLTNGAGTDTPRTRWQLGEDLPIGAVRNMANPSRFDQPDRMTSPYYTADLEERDAGGVHTNSGVGNKAAFLITDGGTFNGETVTGLGIAKAAKIYYEVATNLLTSASDYEDLSYALPQACRNLVGTSGITDADCGEVVDAVNAVDMDEGGPSSSARTAPVCPAAGAPTDLFYDDLEDPSTGNWVTEALVGLNSWYYPQNPNPYFDSTYATSGDTNLWAVDSTEVSDSTISMTRGIPVPTGEVTYLRFNHAYGFEDTGSNAHDGGMLEYSTDGGATWTDAWPLFVDNGYNGTISSGFGNRLIGRRAFVRESNGYGSTRAALASLAGNAVRFRFRIGTGDGFAPDYGWFIDDIRIYTCPTHPPTTTIAGPAKVLSGKRANWTLSAVDPLPDDQAGLFRYAVDWNADGRVDTTVRRGGAIRLSHTYRGAGTRRIVVTARDQHGYSSRAVGKTVTVRLR